MHLAYLTEAMYGFVLGGGVVAVAARARVPPTATGAVAAMPVTAQRIAIACSALIMRILMLVVHRAGRSGSPVLFKQGGQTGTRSRLVV